jgi:hypothetical protein
MHAPRCPSPHKGHLCPPGHLVIRSPVAPTTAATGTPDETAQKNQADRYGRRRTVRINPRARTKPEPTPTTEWIRTRRRQRGRRRQRIHHHTQIRGARQPIKTRAIHLQRVLTRCDITQRHRARERPIRVHRQLTQKARLREQPHIHRAPRLKSPHPTPSPSHAPQVRAPDDHPPSS